MHASKSDNDIRQFLEDLIADLHPLTLPESDAKEMVSGAVEALKTIAPMLERRFSNDALKQRRTYAKELESALVEVQSLLRVIPDDPIHEIFSEREDLQLRSRDETEQRVHSRIDSLIQQLERARVNCSELSQSRTRPNVNWIKFNCATIAYQLMEHVSQNKITGTNTGPFRSIAATLYQAVTGEKDADMKRACDSLLSRTRIARPED